MKTLKTEQVEWHRGWVGKNLPTDFRNMLFIHPSKGMQVLEYFPENLEEGIEGYIISDAYTQEDIPLRALRTNYWAWAPIGPEE